MSGSGDPPKPPPADQQGQQGSAGASSPAAPVAGRKDGWDKLAALTTLISSVVIGGAGVAATYIYNNHELQIKHQEKEAEEKRISEQAKTAYLLETNRRLEALFKYVVSDKTNEREFGYAMFQALGQEDLAVKIIALRRDQAGEAVARSATHSANPQTAAQAKAISSGLRLRNSAVYGRRHRPRPV